MNGVHDCGGMDGLGPIRRPENEPVFEAEWEKRAFALLFAAGAHGHWNLDESRHAIERMDPAHYIAGAYYEHWIDGVERLLIEKGVVTAEELAAKRAQVTAEAAAGAH